MHATREKKKVEYGCSRPNKTIYQFINKLKINTYMKKVLFTSRGQSLFRHYLGQSQNCLSQECNIS